MGQISRLGVDNRIGKCPSEGAGVFHQGPGNTKLKPPCSCSDNSPAERGGARLLWASRGQTQEAVNKTAAHQLHRGRAHDQTLIQAQVIALTTPCPDFPANPTHM